MNNERNNELQREIKEERKK